MFISCILGDYMRYLIVSDIHGSLEYGKRIVELIEEEKADKLILLGDLYYHGPRNPIPDNYNPKELAVLFNSVKEKLICIRGNCDAEVDQMISEFEFLPELKLEIGGKRFFFTHGHHINKDQQPTDTDVLVYGHFHTGFIEDVNGMICMNPGSTTLPKNDTPKSYGIIEDSKLFVKDFEGRVVCEHNL